MKSKHIRKWFRQARELSKDVPCLSRGIGSVIVDPETNTVVSTGINGTARHLPDCDSYEHLKDYVWPQLTKEEKYIVEVKAIKDNLSTSIDVADEFAGVFAGCKQCPRKLVNARSGERLELCQCVHSEANAVHNAAMAGHKTYGCYIFCWCGIPCVECAGSIVQGGIKEVFCLDENRDPGNNTYEFWRSEWIFNKAGVKLNKFSQSWILQENN